MIAIDTDIVVRYLVEDDVAQTDRAEAVLRSGEVLVPKTVLLETAWVLRSRYRFDLAAIANQIVDRGFPAKPNPEPIGGHGHPRAMYPALTSAALSHGQTPWRSGMRSAVIAAACPTPLPVAVVASGGIIAGASEVDGAMERRISMPLGVVVERRELDNRWQRFAWRPVAVIPGAPPVRQWRELVRGERFVRWHAATLPLVLHRTETEAYRANLSGRTPAIYVALREQPAGPHEYVPSVVTASPYEAAGYSEDLVEAVPMPEGLIAWVQDFVRRHHVDEPFQKRKRDKPRPAGPERGQAKTDLGHD